MNIPDETTDKMPPNGTPRARAARQVAAGPPTLSAQKEATDYATGQKSRGPVTLAGKARSWPLEKALITRQMDNPSNADPGPDEPTRASGAVRQFADSSTSREHLNRSEMRFDPQFIRARNALVASREARIGLSLAAANLGEAAQ